MIGNPARGYRASARHRPKEQPMTQRAVSKVEWDSQGRITAVEWGVVDAQSQWTAPPSPTDVSAVVNAIRAGDRVYGLFPASKGFVAGPSFSVVTDGRGQMCLVLDDLSREESTVPDMNLLAGDWRLVGNG
jgi:hypothetical protein